MANHSCSPNASAAPGFPGTLRALRDIAEDEEVTITYGKEKAKFRCRCQTCQARRARYSLATSSTAGIAADFLRKRVKGFGKTRSSSELPGRAKDGHGDTDNGQDHLGWFENAASAFRRMRRGKRDRSSTEDDDFEDPAKKTRGPWKYLGRSSLYGDTNHGQDAPGLAQRIRMYIHDCKAEVARWFGWIISGSRQE